MYKLSASSYPSYLRLLFSVIIPKVVTTTITNQNKVKKQEVETDPETCSGHRRKTLRLPIADHTLNTHHNSPTSPGQPQQPPSVVIAFDNHHTSATLLRSLRNNHRDLFFPPSPTAGNRSGDNFQHHHLHVKGESFLYFSSVICLFWFWL
ncbi:unnamed protein product [Vicia faba]|uniref:Uncharacterized protein n=1 Tax=Vicia faba TaxID=3906 RepID=A0AAV1AZR8_VICFA|nr:unnamed protein product [Vicia faba]